jgi:hypothetical protein
VTGRLYYDTFYPHGLVTAGTYSDYTPFAVREIITNSGLSLLERLPGISVSSSMQLYGLSLFFLSMAEFLLDHFLNLFYSVSLLVQLGSRQGLPQTNISSYGVPVNITT